MSASSSQPQSPSPAPAGLFLAGGSGAPSFEQALRSGASTPQALAIFDALPPVPLESMLGAWRGQSFPTGHPLDAALPNYGWQGKRCDSAEEVHPLVFGWLGRRIHLNPAWVAPALPLVLRFPVLRSPAAGRIVRAGLPLVATRRSRARLRMLAFRGVTSAAIVYDAVPILDLFRQVDGDTVLGLMDRKGLAQPFFFVLRRERP